MRGFDDGHLGDARPQQGSETAGVPAPEDRDQGLIPFDQRGDRPLRDLLPALAAMGGRLPRSDSQDPVEQHDSLPRPGAQIPVRGRRDAEVGLELLVDVAQRPRQRPDIRIDGEGQPDGVARRRIWVLTDDEDLHPSQRLGEGAEDGASGGQVLASGGELFTEEIAHRMDALFHSGQGLSPIGGHDLGHRRSRRHAGESSEGGLECAHSADRVCTIAYRTGVLPADGTRYARPEGVHR